MVDILIYIIIIVPFYYLFNNKINKLQKNYDKLCSVYIDALDQPLKLKELAEDNQKNNWVDPELPLTIKELNYLRGKCISKLYGFFPKDLNGQWWTTSYCKGFDSYTILKKYNTERIYIKYKDYLFLILDEKSKILRISELKSHVTTYCSNITHDETFKVVFERSEVLEYLNKIRKNKD